MVTEFEVYIPFTTRSDIRYTSVLFLDLPEHLKEPLVAAPIDKARLRRKRSLSCAASRRSGKDLLRRWSRFDS